MALTTMDIKQLAKDPSPQVRADLAERIGRNFTDAGYSKAEGAIALDILRLLARDIEVQVRRAVAEGLKNSINAPHDLIFTLANDVAEVALPVLQHSYILSEDDLIHIVKSTREMAKLMAIARRDSVSGELAEELLGTREPKVLHALVHNKGAHLTDDNMHKYWDALTSNSSLLEALVQRGGLSISVAEKLFTVVSDEMKRHLAKTYKLSMTLVEDTVEDIREWATLGMLMPDSDSEDLPEAEVEKLVFQLYSSNRLTYSLIIRALCSGDLPFFESAMAQMAGVPRTNARLLMFDSGPLGFRAFYHKAHMPEGFYEAIRLLLKLSLELTAYGRMKRDDFRRRLVNRIQSEGFDRSVDNMQYLLTVIGGHIAASETRRTVH